MNEPWRWLELPTEASPSRLNMQIDRAIFDSFVEGTSPATVRIYRWSEPCVTYGRLQTYENVCSAFPEQSLYIRPTGGKAVLHGDDLTVTVVADETYLSGLSQTKGVLASYRVLLSGLLDTYAALGIVADIGAGERTTKSEDCFASIGKCDVVDLSSDQKIVGCAQRRSRGAIIQQMSLRPHSRYHIESNDFVALLQKRLRERLQVPSWTNSTVLTPRELALTIPHSEA